MKLTRYMKINRYKDLLSKRTLFFPCYDKLGDPYEGSLGRIPTDRLLDKLTGKLSRITTRRLSPQTLAREFLETFEPLLYHDFLREFTFVSCWHQSEIESMPMWKMYAGERGIMIKSDLSSLKNSLGIASDGYKHSNVFQKNHGVDSSDGYEILIETNPINYISHGNYIEPIGLDRYFHKQLEYADEREFRVIFQLRLGPEHRFNFPYLFDSIKLSTHNIRKPQDIISQFWTDIKLSYEKHAAILNEGLSECGVRCPVNINSLIKEVVISPFSTDSDVREIESLNHEFGIMAEVKKSVIEIAPSPTKLNVRLSDEVTIELEL